MAKKKNIKFVMSYKLLGRKDLSLGAKVLYGVIFNRYNCSLREENQDRFVDEDNETFCIISNKEACERLDCSQPTATKWFDELENAGLIVRRKRYNNKTDLIKIVPGKNAID